MNLVKNIYSKKAYFALDFGAERVAVVVAERESPEKFRVIGAGDARAEGVSAGEITHLGDAVEAVVEAVGKAERSSGLRAETLYYNFDDAGMESRLVDGSKTLAGEGEIGPADVLDAREMAERMAGHFEKNIVYAREVRFLIDERDTVEDPVGAFGAHLHATVHILQARSAHCQNWQKLMRRAKIDRAARIVSPWSTAYGVLPACERKGRKLIVDLGGDLVSVFLFESARVSACSFFAAGSAGAPETAERALSAATALAARSQEPEEVLLTGDRAGDPASLDVFKRGPFAPRVAPAQGVAKLDGPQYASLAGLLSVAEEMEKRNPILQSRRGLLLDVKERAVTFINEYF